MGVSVRDENGVALANGLMEDNWTVTGSATSTIAISQAAVATREHHITQISGYTSVAGKVALLKDGATLKWQMILPVGIFDVVFSPPMAMTQNTTPSLTVTSSGAAIANMSGYVL